MRLNCGRCTQSDNLTPEKKEKIEPKKYQSKIKEIKIKGAYSLNLRESEQIL
jgi:hypothetical protein